MTTNPTNEREAAFESFFYTVETDAKTIWDEAWQAATEAANWPAVDEVVAVEVMATALNDSPELGNQGFSFNERLAKICFKAICPYLAPSGEVVEALKAILRRCEQVSIHSSLGWADILNEIEIAAKAALNHGKK